MDSVSAKKTYLFLQGPHGSFMAKLAARLMGAGHAVRRINFNGGDWIDWPFKGADNYQGAGKEWSAYLDDYISRHGVTDIVLYGYWRPLHKAAIDLARQRGIAVHGFEEGLLRPYWITLSSRFPHEQGDDLKAQIKAGLSCAEDTQQSLPPIVTGDNHGSMLLYCYRYYTAYFLSAPLFWRHRSHRGLFPFIDMMKWVWHFFVYPWRQHQSHRKIVKLLKSRIPFFLLCLQLDGDSQIRQYSPYRGMADMMEEVIKSFAQNAPSGARLAIKRHPLDNHGYQHELTCRKLAQRYGVEEDVVFIPYGKLAPLLKRARGAIMVNSSTGFSALYHNCPVKALGQAAYNIDGLTDKKSLHDFWSNPANPDMNVYRAMERALRRTTQYPGGFYAVDAQDIAISACFDDMMVESNSMPDNAVKRA